MIYTDVAKPTGPTYTGVNSHLITYDEATISYDDPSMFYDGVNQSLYTEVSKPIGPSYTNVSKPV